MDAIGRDVALLYRRFAFGGRPAELAAAAALGYDAAVDHLLDLSARDGADAIPAPSLSPDATPPTDPAARTAYQQKLRLDGVALVDWWMQRMVASTTPAREKVVLLWHGHFATAIDKVRAASLMYGQNVLFRTAGSGPFRDLVHAVAKDPAMLIWLDSNSNVKAHANENFARELMELFTLGIGAYTEDDVKEAARCFTGWTYNRATQAFQFQPTRHDGGSKRLLGQTGNFGGEDAIDVIVGRPESSRFVTAKVWSHLAYPVAPDDPVVADLVATAPATVRDLLAAIARHPQFRSDDARTGLVKQPIEWLVSALRLLGVAYDPKFGAILSRLGQVPFDPPSVGGWPQNQYWVSTAAALARLAGAAQIVAGADLHAVTTTAPAQRVGACAQLLGIDAWSPATADALSSATGDPRALVALALVSPEFVLN